MKRSKEKGVSEKGVIRGDEVGNTNGVKGGVGEGKGVLLFKRCLLEIKCLEEMLHRSKGLKGS